MGSQQVDTRALAHDLRQHIANIMFFIDAAEEDCTPSKLSRLRSECSHMSSLCRLLQQSATAPVQPVELAAIATDVVRTYQYRFDGKLSFDVASTAPVSDPVGVRRAVANLVDNACRAAGPTGEVDVWIACEFGQAFVEVVDSGPGFGRIPAGSEGLGLIVARDVARMHEGDVDITATSRGRTLVRLRLGAEVPSMPQGLGEDRWAS